MILKCEKYLVTYKSLKMDAAEFLIENPYWFSWVCAQEIMCNPLGSIQLFSLQLCKCRSWICTFVIMVLTLLTRPLSRSWFYAKRKRPFSGQRAVFFFILRGNLLLWSSINVMAVGSHSKFIITSPTIFHSCLSHQEIVVGFLFRYFKIQESILWYYSYSQLLG